MTRCESDSDSKENCVNFNALESGSLDPYLILGLVIAVLSNFWYGYKLCFFTKEVNQVQEVELDQTG